MPKSKKPRFSSRPLLAGVGVDLVYLPRMRHFLSQHSSQKINCLLTPGERRSFITRKRSVLWFAQVWAAKEAFFKASGASWMGTEGFGKIEIKCFPRHRFQVKSSLIPGKEQVSEGRFFNKSSWIGAQVIMWQKSADSSLARIKKSKIG